MYYEMYPISHFISERQKNFHLATERLLGLKKKKNLAGSRRVKTTPGGTQLEVPRDNRSINKLPLVLPTAEGEDNSKVCNLKEQNTSEGQPRSSRVLAVEISGRNYCPPKRETWQQMLQLT